MKYPVLHIAWWLTWSPSPLAAAVLPNRRCPSQVALAQVPQASQAACLHHTRDSAHLAGRQAQGQARHLPEAAALWTSFSHRYSSPSLFRLPTPPLTLPPLPTQSRSLSDQRCSHAACLPGVRDSHADQGGHQLCQAPCHHRRRLLLPPTSQEGKKVGRHLC